MDLRIQHNINLPGHARLNVGVNVTNLFDNDVATSLWDAMFRDRITLSPVETFFNGFDPIATAAASTSIRPDPRFYGGVTPARNAADLSKGQPMNRIFLDRREVRVGMRLTF